MDFLDKLDYLIAKTEINKNVLAKESGIPYTTIDGFYKKGYENTKLSTIRKLSNYFDVSLDYFMRDEITDENYGKTTDFKIEYSEMEHIKKYRDLDNHGKKMVDFVVSEEYARCQAKLEAEIAEEFQPQIRVRYIDLPVSAGFGADLFDEGDEDYINVPDTPTTRIADYALKVSGDSMEPAYYDGDIVFVKQQQCIDVGQIGIFLVDGEGFIKSKGEEWLESLNRKYPDIKPGIASSVYCMGLVIGNL